MSLRRTWIGLLLAISGIQAAGRVPQNDGVISGRVVRVGGVEGVPQAEILLAGPLTTTAVNAANQNPLMLAEIAEGSSSALARHTSASDGSFVFRDLAPGQYMVRAQRDGFLGDVSAVTGTFLNAASASVTIAAGVATPEVRLAMMRGATISGRVRDSNGQPVPSRTVTAFQIGYRDGREILVPVTSRATDDRGEYRLFWVGPGDYYLGATVTAGPSTPILLQRSAVLRTFYPNVSDARSAAVITVTEGLEFTGADIELRPPSTFKVAGRLVSSLPARDGQQTATASTFFLFPIDLTHLLEGAVPASANAATTPGLFEIQGVRPGTYDLVATVPDNTGRPFPGRVRIDVGSQDLEGVTLAINPGVEVKARVMLDGKFVEAPLSVAPPRNVSILPVLTPGGAIAPPAPQPSVTVSSVPGVVPIVQLRSREINPSPFDSYVGPSVTSDPSGVFVYPGVPQGVYSVVASGVPDGVYVADIRAGGIGIYDDGLIVGDRAPEMIDVILNSGAVSIQGTVRDAEARAVTSATVVLVPAPARRKNPMLYRTMRVSGNGEFKLNNVPPGQYKLFAWETIPNGAYMNAAFLSKHEARGLSVNLLTGGNLSFDLTVIPASDTR